MMKQIPDYNREGRLDHPRRRTGQITAAQLLNLDKSVQHIERLVRNIPASSGTHSKLMSSRQEMLDALKMMETEYLEDK